MEGRKISHYLIREKLGGGGMGVVYRAEDLRLGRTVAIKLLPESYCQDHRALRRFEQEARAASALNHPNICTIYDVDEFSGRPFLVMEYLVGQTLKHRLDCGPLEVDQLLEFAIQISRGLEAAHLEGIIHRDVKPANIFVSDSGPLKLLDFGLAKRSVSELEASSETDQTAFDLALSSPGIAMGTISYMSPEQARGLSLDTRSDLFSFGVVLFEMATGQQPFKGSSGAVVLSSILTADPPSPSSLNIGLPGIVDRITRRLLEKNPEHRYPSAGDLIKDLLRTQEGWESGLYSATGTAAERSIAVLPFSDLSPKQDHGYFSDGLADELISALNSLIGLRVASRTSSFALKAHGLDVRQIGDRLNVETLLDGSVRREKRHIRIFAQLVGTRDGYQIWSDTFDVQAHQIFEVQERIAKKIVESLSIKLAQDQQANLGRRPTKDVEAFDLYCRGRQYFYRSKKTSIGFAIELFEKAIAKDSAYGRAYAGLADCYSYFYMYFGHSRSDLIRAIDASRSALELAPQLAESHASRGLALSLTGDFEGAGVEFERALALNPHLFEGYYFYARTCFAAGRVEEAARYFREASRVNPEDYQSLLLLTFTSRVLGRHDQALRASELTLRNVQDHLQLHPDDSRAIYVGAEALSVLGQEETCFEWARRAFEIDPNDPYIVYGLACLYSRTGHTAQGLDYFERSVRAGFAHREWIEHDADLDSIRGTERFAEVLKLIGN